MINVLTVKIALFVLLGIAARRVDAAPVELEFAKGVVAYSQGKLDLAADHFMSVLSQAPEHVQACAYLGQVELGRGHPVEAVKHLRRAGELEPGNMAIRLDLALALVRLEQFVEAEKILAGQVSLGGDASAAQYYLGFCRYKLGRVEEAVKSLEKVQGMEGDFGSAAVYYLGLAHAKLGNKKQALAQFESLAGTGGQQNLVRLARENMARLQGSGGGSRSWGLSASLGGGYDSNVALTTVDTADAAAAGMFLAAGAYWRPLERKQDRVQLDFRLFRSFHFSETTEGFDLTDLGAGLDYQRMLGQAFRIRAGYVFDVDLIDELASVGAGEGFGLFMQAHQALAGLSWRWSARAELGLRYSFRAAFFEQDERNHFAHEVLLTQDLLFFDGRFHVGLQAGVQVEDAKGLDWDLWGPVAAFESRLRLIESLQVWGRVDFRREDHHHFDVVWLPDERRVDNLLGLAAGLTWQFSDNLSLLLSYRYLQNLADEVDLDIDPFGYDRHSVSLAFMGRL